MTDNVTPAAASDSSTSVASDGSRQAGRVTVAATAHEQLSRMISGCCVTQMLHVAARLELADRLAARSRPVTELAQETGCHEPSLYRLLRGLAGLGIFAEETGRRFKLTELSEFMRKDHPFSAHGAILMMGGFQYPAWGEMLFSVQTGRTAFEKLHGTPLFDYLSTRPDAAAIFDAAMVSIHGRETSAILEAYDFSVFREIVDLGGGNGSQLCGLLQANPKVRGTVFDLPHVVERAAQQIAAQGLTDRCRTVAGSFFDDVPAGADAYLLRHVIHDWDDDQSQTILKAVRRAIPPEGKLLVIEAVIPPGNVPGFAKMLDLTMLVMAGGKERTNPEYRQMLAKAGFRVTSIVPTTSEVAIIESVPT